jgi:hypothetical protein
VCKESIKIPRIKNI